MGAAMGAAKVRADDTDAAPIPASIDTLNRDFVITPRVGAGDPAVGASSG
jgi:hypothetical protein